MRCIPRTAAAGAQGASTLSRGAGERNSTGRFDCSLSFKFGSDTECLRFELGEGVADRLDGAGTRLLFDSSA
jgi:hypothetical protein